VGINTAIVGDSYQGIGFAIPSSVAKPVYERIKSMGRVQRGWLGVRPVMVTEDRMRDQALPDTSGAAVLTVQPKSPAELGGIQPNDVIIQWNGHAIEKWTDLYTMVAATPIGTKVAVTIIRGGAPEELTVVVNERPEEG
jgi:serine protease Do